MVDYQEQMLAELRAIRELLERMPARVCDEYAARLRKVQQQQADIQASRPSPRPTKTF